MRNEGAAHKSMEAPWSTKSGDARKSLDSRLPSYRQPSPRGEGAPKGRIGHRRYEKQMRKAEKCAVHVGKV